ncbi:uncharacterized protein LOC142179839 [Nicotiana tabacum]|uniref:Uncharacterized protein LOC142179839 n=1 Tax=Nicotiana tabacum TaxID=4097 RepID=A0AC58UBG2_TOBAC
MVSKDKIEGYMRFLGFQGCISNDNGKIWCFWKNICHTIVSTNDEQHITIKIEEGSSNITTVITAVYAKCTSRERKDLWSSLENDNNGINGPWCIGGDFNIFLEPDVKLGGNPHKMSKSLDFMNCMDNCGMTDIGFSGAKFTWCSDHRPLLMKCFDKTNNHIKYFRFLNFWTKQDDFLNIVKEGWDTHISGNNIWRLQAKLKLLSRKLSQWSRESIGDIQSNIIKWEEKIQSLEEMGIINNTEADKSKTNKAHAEYIRWIDMQEFLNTQKANIKWFGDGDRNTSYFHSLLREKRRKLQLDRIKNHKGK